jgi:hypothetical protein
VIIKSLGKINLDGFGPKMSALGQSLQAGVWDKPQPDIAKSHPQMAGSAAQQADATLQQILHFDYADFPPSPRKASRFLREELHYQILLQYTDDNKYDDWGFGNCRKEIENFLSWEIEKSDHAYIREDEDSELLSAMERVLDPKPEGRNYQVSVVLKALELRAKIQSSFFSVFMFLTDICLVTFEGLKEPMDPSYSSDLDVQLVAASLGCFENIRKMENDWEETFNFNVFFNSMTGYRTPANWLATLIVRGAVVQDLHGIMDKIELLGEFGVLGREKLQKLWSKNKKLVRNHRAGAIKPPAVNQSPVVAFWLPYNLGEKISMEEIYKAFDEDFFIPFEDLFFRFFSLPNDPNLKNELRSAKALSREIKDGMEF